MSLPTDETGIVTLTLTKFFFFHFLWSSDDRSFFFRKRSEQAAEIFVTAANRGGRLQSTFRI